MLLFYLWGVDRLALLVDRALASLSRVQGVHNRRLSVDIEIDSNYTAAADIEIDFNYIRGLLFAEMIHVYESS